MVWSPSKDVSPLTTMTGVEMPAAGQEEEAWRNPTPLDRYQHRDLSKIGNWEELVKDKNHAVVTYRPPAMPGSQVIGP